jgi:hypothetical protein
MPKQLSVDELINRTILLQKKQVHQRTQEKQAKMPKWTPEEEEFVRKNIGNMSDSEIAIALGRTYYAVRVHRTREMGLGGQSRAEGILTPQVAAKMLGIDSHKVAHWADVGIMPSIKSGLRNAMRKDQYRRLILRGKFFEWCTDFNNWIYFKIDKVVDPELKSLLEKKSKEINDEWWRTNQVADYYGTSTNAVMNEVKRGRLAAVQVSVSYGGRNKNPSWKIWFIKKSEALRDPGRFRFGARSGSPGKSRKFNKQQIEKIVYLHDVEKKLFSEIATIMASNPTTMKLWYCRSKGLADNTDFRSLQSAKNGKKRNGKNRKGKKRGRR